VAGLLTGALMVVWLVVNGCRSPKASPLDDVPADDVGMGAD
jgi:hypothetical protein